MPTRPRNVLVALTDTHHGYLVGVIRYAREHRWQLVADMIYTAKIPHGWKGDGIVSFIGFRDDLARFIRDSGLPAVDISFLREDLPLPKVGGDDGMIGRMAAEHFLERGYKHFAWAPFIPTPANSERFASFSRNLADAGFACHTLPPLDHGEDATGQTHDWAARRHKLITELERLPKPLAVFAFNDCVACDVLAACEEARIPVPESVAVLGVDNDPLFREIPGIPLSSIRHDLEGMAYEAAALLDRLMSGESPPAEPLRLAPKGLVTRRSTDMLAVDNLHVARALRFIRDEYAKPTLDVTDVVRASGLSRRSLENAFRHELDRTIGGEITRVRLEKVRRLLETGEWTITGIAAATGFSRPNHLHRLFKRHFGVTPKTFQETHAPKSPAPENDARPLPKQEADLSGGGRSG